MITESLSYRELQQMAAAASAVGDYSTAKKVCGSLLTLNGKDGSIWYTRGVSNYYSAQMHDAINDFKTSLVYRPNHFYSYYYMAKSYIELHDYKNAKKSILASLAIQPDNRQALNIKNILIEEKAKNDHEI